MSKLKSTAVKIFPSAFRGLATGTKYNPEARLNTEFNITNLINRLASKDSFVISWNPSSQVIIFNIHGYYFENNLVEFLGTGGEGASLTNIYASIKIRPFANFNSNNTSYQAFTLVGTGDTFVTVQPSTGRILDTIDSGTAIFEGLDLHGTPDTPEPGIVYELLLLSRDTIADQWSVPVTSALKFKATDIEGLPTINNSTTANTTSTIFAAATAGTAGQLSVSQGGTSAPTWITPTSTLVGLGNVTNESKETMFSSPTFTGTVSGITAAMVGAEPVNANIQSHISSTTNPHSVTKTQVGLSNVTNDAQIKKRALSTNGNVPTWSVITGDALNDGYTVQTALSSSSTALVRADAIQTALNLKANITSPAFTGNPTAPTQIVGNNSTRIATTEFVGNKFKDFIKYDYTFGQTLSSTTEYANTDLELTGLKTGTFYKFKVYVTYTRNSGTNSTGVNFTLTHNQTGGSPTPNGKFFSVYNATNNATSLTLLGLKPISNSASDSNSLQLPVLSTFVGSSFFVLEGTHFTGNSTSLTLKYKYTSDGVIGQLNIDSGSYIVAEQMFT